MNLPANASAPHVNSDLALLELLALLDALEGGRSLTDPQIVLRVGENTNVGLGSGGSHCNRNKSEGNVSETVKGCREVSGLN